MLNIPVRSTDTKKIPHSEAWAALSDAIRQYDADFVILVARKMPRLVDALQLNLGENAICVSDQAIPFILPTLKGARIAIVDDVWNVGTTMLRARQRVEAAQPAAIQMFALGAKDARKATEQGTRLIIRNALGPEQYKSIVDSVPVVLSRITKPYDADFPIIPCLLGPAFGSWTDCWNWLRSQYGDNVHSTTTEEQILAGYARAAVRVRADSDWTVKARLYFDFARGLCNVVPIALARDLSLKNDYPEHTLSQSIFAVLEKELARNVGVRPALIPATEKDGWARANIFCDSLMFSKSIIESLGGLLQPDSSAPFSVAEFRMQFGTQMASSCEKLFVNAFLEPDQADFEELGQQRAALQTSPPYSLLNEEVIAATARTFLQEGLPVLAMDALFQSLGQAVGADNPDNYSLTRPYTRDEVKQDPYLRLRLGVTYDQIVDFFHRHLKESAAYSTRVESVVSELMDIFIDRGAIVPTFTAEEGYCKRIYRKGEANGEWDFQVSRLRYALNALTPERRGKLFDGGRTRIAKILAVMSFSESDGASLMPGSLERGTVGMLMPSVVEGQGVEVTGYMLRTGQWN